MSLGPLCKQGGPRSGGSREKCLIRVCPVFAYEDMKYLIIHKWNLCNTLVLRLQNVLIIIRPKLYLINDPSIKL